MLIGPVWPRLTLGAATVPAATAADPAAMVFRNDRRPLRAFVIRMSSLRLNCH
jgi:hypothetical protein